MSPNKRSVDAQPPVVNSATRIPGQVGWGVERSHLKAKSTMLTDDTRVASFPIPRDHVQDFDKNRTNLFVRYHGGRAAEMDKKLNVDYQMYHAMNMQA